MDKLLLGWISGKMNCRIEKYFNDKNDVLYKINCGQDIDVIGFSDYNEALKFVYKMAWTLV